jgi:hypothetical protein
MAAGDAGEIEKGLGEGIGCAEKIADRIQLGLGELA